LAAAEHGGIGLGSDRDCCSKETADAKRTLQVHAHSLEIPHRFYAPSSSRARRFENGVVRTAAGEIRHDTEPGVGALKQLWVGFLSILPFEWLL
jgi:hypothetical protein